MSRVQRWIEKNIDTLYQGHAKMSNISKSRMRKSQILSKGTLNSDTDFWKE